MQQFRVSRDISKKIKIKYIDKYVNVLQFFLA